MKKRCGIIYIFDIFKAETIQPTKFKKVEVVFLVCLVCVCGGGGGGGASQSRILTQVETSRAVGEGKFVYV